MKKGRGIRNVAAWLCVIVLAGTVYYLNQSNRRKELELRQLRSAGEEVKQLRAELERSKTIGVGDAELQRLRKENQEVYKLRNDVAQLRKQLQQTTSSIKTTASATTEGVTDNEQIQQLLADNERLRAENEEAKAQLAREPANICIANLKQLEGAKQQWALENKKDASATPTEDDLFGANKYINQKPACPSGGTYTLNDVSTPAACSIPEHSLLP
jgi:hypothetical protein